MIGSVGRTDAVRFKRGFDKGLLRDNCSFFWRQFLIKLLFPIGDKLLAKHLFLYKQGKKSISNPLSTGLNSNFPTPDNK